MACSDKSDLRNRPFLNATTPSNIITVLPSNVLSDCRMVLLKTTIAGCALLVVGILLLTVAGQYVTVEAREVQTRSVEPHAEFLVGDTVDKSYNLPANVEVLGTLDATQAPSNQTGSIRFLVFDADNYQKWLTGGQASSIYSAEKQGPLNFTFTTGTDGIYHFVFDNHVSLYKQYVTFTVAYNEVIRSRIPDTRVGYVGWVFAIMGGLIAAYGLLRKPPVSWA